MDKRYQAFVRDTDDRIIAASDWIPGNALIQDGSWYLDEDGTLRFEWEGETKMCWDGCATETHCGLTVYVAESEVDVPEDEIVLREVDEDGELIEGAPELPFTPKSMGSPFNDHAVQRQMALSILGLSRLLVLQAQGEPMSLEDATEIASQVDVALQEIGFHPDRLGEDLDAGVAADEVREKLRA